MSARQSGGAFDTLTRVLEEREPTPYSFRLRLEELTLAVRSNSAGVISDLRGYFAPFGMLKESAPADLDFLLLDGPVATSPVELATRPHLPGKRPDKERVADLPGAEGGGRIVRKQATGMLFVFGGRGVNIALGPCGQNRNQLVNFLCARYMERRVAQGWVLGHAAGVARPQAFGGKALALCGFAGMGKSTLALHLVARGCDFLSNDRALVESCQGQVPILHGIPKHPRLNPGTALGNPELAALLACALPETLRRSYSSLSADALYTVEDKYDAIIDECFGAAPGGGASRFRLTAPLAGLVVLNWKHGGGPLETRRVNLAERPDLLEVLRKSPGAFYLDAALRTARLTAAGCLEALSGVPALELRGGSDFSAGATACLEFLGE
jgi:HprK-related kinase B